MEPTGSPAGAGQPSRLKGVLRDERLQGAFVLLILLVIFFSTPIVKLRTHTYSAADYVLDLGLTMIDEAYTPENGLLSDTAVLFQPWLMFNRASIRAGTLPLWNPYNAGGIPHIGNYQSAVFSVYTLPFYLFSFKAALLLSAMLKLYSLGVFTFLFLNVLNLRLLPALVGAVAFMYSGYNIVWLGYSLPAAVITLPAALYYVERAFSAYSRHGAGSTFWPLAGLSMSLAIGLLAGHPETFYGCFLLVAAYIAFRLASLWRDRRYSRDALSGLVAMAGKLCLAGIAAASLSAVQLVPFFEYLAHSNASHNARASLYALPTTLGALAFYPDLLGNPSHHPGIDLLSAYYTNYNETNGAYIGAFVVFLALLGGGIALSERTSHRRTGLFFAASAVLWFVYATNAFGVKPLFNLIPGMSLTWANRTYPVWLFALSVLAALCVQRVSEDRARPRTRLWIGAVLAATAFLVMGAWSAYSLLVGLPKLAPQIPGTPTAWQHYATAVSSHIQSMTIASGAGMIALLALWLTRRAGIRVVCSAVVLGVAFWQSGALLKDFNPTIPNGLYYPDTEDIRALRDTIDTGNLLATETLIIPNANMMYRLPLIGSYDALGVRYYTDLLSAAFELVPAGPQLVRGFDEAALRLFQVDTVAVYNPAAHEDVLSSGHFELFSSNGRSYSAIFRFTDSVPLYRVVHEVQVARSDEEALSLVRAPGFDPATSVVLSESPVTELQTAEADSAADTPDSDVQILAETAMSVELRAAQQQPGYLVLGRTFYPGWKARVNGVVQPVLRANYAFSAIPLAAGDSIVEYYYDPDSFRIALLLSGGTTVLGLLLMGRMIMRQRGVPNRPDMR